MLVHKFVCKGTLEERIDQMIRDKQELADNVLGEGSETLLTEMTTIIRLLGHAGKYNGLPKYNDEFFRGLNAIKDAGGEVTADVIWRVGDEMLRLYFGIGS